MSKGKRTKSEKRQRYFNLRTRIKNKTRRLKKRIKNIKPETQEKVLKSTIIQRKRERTG